MRNSQSTNRCSGDDTSAYFTERLDAAVGRTNLEFVRLIVHGVQVLGECRPPHMRAAGLYGQVIEIPRTYRLVKVERRLVGAAGAANGRIGTSQNDRRWIVQ